ncbi:YqzL family protein [Paenibacillus donghaensis]|uniref:YqzL family protein n=1 Tax=Paenibacillus donghaensis TaxID=414771 RepID=A0A2Z2KUX6_9BACL|nr:YqzL family protein [Paenibacillus donghaensis]ASA23598.1 YqzL family protein [Paenibacillus donghaensis]
MRNFSWKYFAMTGDVDAYLLYKEAGFPSEESVLPVEEEKACDEEAF